MEFKVSKILSYFLLVIFLFFISCKVLAATATATATSDTLKFPILISYQDQEVAVFRLDQSDGLFNRIKSLTVVNDIYLAKIITQDSLFLKLNQALKEERLANEIQINILNEKNKNTSEALEYQKRISYNYKIENDSLKDALKEANHRSKWQKIMDFKILKVEVKTITTVIGLLTSFYLGQKL